jgi:hypothetical protein
LGFKSFRSARITLGGIGTIHMIHNGQVKQKTGQHPASVQQFYSPGCIENTSPGTFSSRASICDRTRNQGLNNT